MTLLAPDQSAPARGVIWIPVQGVVTIDERTELPTRLELQEWVEGEIEYVWVLYEERRECVIVNEMGATRMRTGYPLPVNARATDIYWNYSRSRGELPDADTPRIHGRAALLLGFMDQLR